MSDFNSKAARTARVALVLALAGTGLVATAGSSSAVSVAATLSATTGPSGGGNTITATTSTAKFYAGTVVEFQYSALSTTACTANYASPVAMAASPVAGIVSVSGTAVKVLSTTKVAITIPSTVALPGSLTSFNFNVCVYPGTSTTSSALLANAKYAIAAAPTLASSGTVSPAGGPALGLGTITVTGTNFITGLTATLGGQPINNINVVGSTTFTGTAPPHAAGPVTLSVSTTGGTITKTLAYTYSDGLVVSPQTAPQGTSTVLDVAGVGFTAKTFTQVWDGASNDANAHVYLVAGAYNGADDTHGVKTKGETAECVNVLVISDTELLCTLDTSNSYTSVEAAADVRAAADGVTASASATVSSAADALFTAADVGAVITGAGVPAGTTILSVTPAASPATSSTALMSAAATGVSAGGVTIGVAPKTRATADPVTTSGSKTVSSAADALFTSADVGAAVYGAGIPAGTTITAVTPAVSPATISTATLSANATGASAAGVWIGVPVPNGTYTVTTVADGTVDGTATPSIISSNSTFTVAAY